MDSEVHAKTIGEGFKAAYSQTPSKSTIKAKCVEFQIEGTSVPSTAQNISLSKRRLSAPQNQSEHLMQKVEKPSQEQSKQNEDPMSKIIFTDQVEIVEDKEGKKHINEFTLGKKIGRGAFGKVKKVTRIFKHLDSQEATTAEYAMKIMHKPSLQHQRTIAYDGSEMRMSNNLEKVYNEIDTWAGLLHPNIVRLYELIDSEEHDYIYLVMELIDSGQIANWDEDKLIYIPDQKIKEDLTNHLQKLRLKSKEKLEKAEESGENKPNNEQKSEENQVQNKEQSKDKDKEEEKVELFDEDIARLIFRDVLDGIQYLHSQLIAHRDLKLDNILYSFQQNCTKICDFTVSKKVSNQETRCFESQGTTAFIAPECIITGDQGYSPFPIDIWSFGVCIYSYISGKMPFIADSELEMQIKTKEEEVPMMQYFSPDLKDIITKCLNKDPTQRPTATALTQHPWFTLSFQKENN